MALTVLLCKPVRAEVSNNAEVVLLLFAFVWHVNQNGWM